MQKLRYIETITINPGAAGRAYHAFSANNLYDPNYTGTGHQPRNFDNLAAYYNHYTVVGAKMTARYIPEVAKSTSSAPAYLWATITTYVDPLAGENADASCFEGPACGKRVVVRGGDDGNTAKFPTVVKQFSAKKLFGTKNIVGVTPYRASVTSAPTEEAYFTVYMQHISGNDPPVYSIEVTIDYIAVFTEPKQVGAS